MEDIAIAESKEASVMQKKLKGSQTPIIGGSEAGDDNYDELVSLFVN